MNPTNDTTKPPSRTELREYDVIVPTADGKNIAYKVPLMVPMEWDDTIDSWLLTPDAMLEIENTKARHMGLLLPDEIKALREKLGLTQQQVADLLKIGDKTWTRWETGAQRPSQSLNLILKALQSGLLTPSMLQQLDADASQIDWTKVVDAVAADTDTEPATFKLDLPEYAHAGNYEELSLAA